MSEQVEVETRQDSGRLIAFSDGVVAIAITLLILPLSDVELPTTPEAQQNPLAYIWQQNQSLILSFLLSWFVILIFWLAHHRMFADVEHINSTIIRWNTLWLFGIIILPFPMNLFNQVGPDATSELAARQTTTFYIGTMFFISLMAALMSREIRLHPELLKASAQDHIRARTLRSWVVTAYFGLLVPFAWFFPTIAVWGLIGLWFIKPISRKVDDIATSG